MKKTNVIEVKAQTEVLYTLKILSNDAERLTADIVDLLNSNKQLRHAPVVLQIEDKNFQANELAILVEILTQNNIVAVGVRSHKQELIDFAQFSGLAVFTDLPPPNKIQPSQPTPTQNKVYTAPKIVADKIRSLTQIIVKDNDLVLLNTVKIGAEVIADGSVSAYKEVNGSIFAGVSGNEKATIFINSFNAQLICIAGVYKKFDTVPVKLYARPVMIDLQNGKLRFQIV